MSGSVATSRKYTNKRQNNACKQRYIKQLFYSTHTIDINVTVTQMVVGKQWGKS